VALRGHPLSPYTNFGALFPSIVPLINQGVATEGHPYKVNLVILQMQANLPGALVPSRATQVPMKITDIAAAIPPFES